MLNGVNAHGLDKKQDHPRIGLIVVSAVRFFQTAAARLLEDELGTAEIRVASSLQEALEAKKPGDVVLVDASTVSPPEDIGAASGEFEGRLAVFGLRLEDRTAIARWVAAGATVFIPSDADQREVVDALKSAVRGEVRCSAAFAEVVIREAPRIANGMLRTSRSSKLTPRETQIASLIDKGMSNQEIATQLSISISTVKNHVHSILKRLGARSRAEAARSTRLAT